MRKVLAAIAGLVAAGLLASGPPALAQTGDTSAQEQARRQQVQPLNNAPLWREVRSGDPGYTSVKGPETGVLIQSGGETWREARVPLAVAGGLIIAVALASAGVFWLWKGALPLHDKPTGRMIRRFSTLERATHWTLAISFLALATTGVIIVFGKYVLLPVLGYTLFAWLATAAKNLHNFVSPIFMVSVPVFIVLFIRDNLPKARDFEWLVKFGGLLSDTHVPSGRFNAGEKIQFWGLVVALSSISALSGLILLFPNFEQTRSTMQVANVVHIGAAMFSVAMAIGHIYMGAIRTKGAFEAMRYGYVDETWAKEHHGDWYEEVRTGRSRQKFADDDVPAEVVARVREAIQHG